MLSGSDLMQCMHHLPIREQAINLHRVLRGHYAYYGIAGSYSALLQLETPKESD